MNHISAVTITWPRSAVLRFYAERNADNPKAKNLRECLRLGQHFHQFMQLEKVQMPVNKEFCDRLYEATHTAAGRMIVQRTDWEN
jgi:hypothetical protein